MKNKRIRNISIISLFVILFTYLVILINSYMNGEQIGILSYRFYIMSSNNPETNTSSGDLIIAKSIKIEDIKQNDNIIYKKGTELIVRSVKSINNENGNINLFVDGSNDKPDEEIANAQIVGKVVTKVGGIGNVALFLKTPMGAINLLIILGCVIILIRKIGDSDEEELEKEDLVKKVGNE